MTRKGILDSLYANFIMRDLVYIVGGGMILTSAKYLISGDLKDGFDLITGNFIAFLIFIVLSYFLGVIITQGYLSTRIYKIARIPNMDSGKYRNYIILEALIERKYGESACKKIERVNFLRLACSALFASSLTSFFLVAIATILHLGRRPEDFVSLFILLLIAATSLVRNRENRIYLNKIYNEFSEYIEEEGKSR